MSVVATRATMPAVILTIVETMTMTGNGQHTFCPVALSILYVTNQHADSPVASKRTMSRKYCIPIALSRYRLIRKMKQTSTIPYSSDSTPLNGKSPKSSAGK
jgi:hypothetical protein